MPPVGSCKSRESLYAYINKWAESRGYAFVTGRSTVEKNGLRTVTYTCDRACKPADVSKKRRRKTSTRGTGCQFSVLSKECPGGSWGVKHRNPEFHHHNHPPSPHPAAHPAHRQLGKVEKECISTLLSTRAAPKDVQIYMREQGITSFATRQDIQNCISQTRRDICEGQSTIHALITQLNNEGFWSRIQFDDNRRVTGVLFAHTQSLAYLEAYPDVLLLDCTYMTNKYNMPLLELIGFDACQRSFCIAFAFLSGETEGDYEWVLGQLQSLYTSCNIRLPSVILTDRCLACLNALNVVFYNAVSLLCLWHANKAVLAHCLPIFTAQERLLAKLSSIKTTNQEESAHWKEFYAGWHGIISSPTESTYRERLAAFEKKYVPNHVEEVAYIKEVWLEPYKEKLVKAWVDLNTHFGNVVTSRVEGIHALIKAYLKTSQLDLFEAWRTIRHAILNQLYELTYRQSYQQTQVPLELSGNLYSAVRGWVSFEALRKTDEQRELIYKDNSPSLRPCTGRFTRSYELPCVHRIKQLLDASLPLALEEFHSQWHYKRDGQPIHLIEPQRIERRKANHRVAEFSTQRSLSAFETVNQQRQKPKCSSCGAVGHTRVSRSCPNRHQHLLSQRLVIEPASDVGTPSQETIQSELREDDQLPSQLQEANQTLSPARSVIEVVNNTPSSQPSSPGISPQQSPQCKYDSPVAIYRRYTTSRSKWYSRQPHRSKRTDQLYRKAMGLPPRYRKADYDWCLDWKEMGQLCKTAGKPRKWTKEEMTAYIDWSRTEDQRVEAMVANEIMHNPQERTRRGVGAIWRQIEQDSMEQQTLHTINTS